MRKYAAVDVSSFSRAPNVEFFRAAMSQTLCWPEDKGGQVTDNVSAPSDLWDKCPSCQAICFSFYMNRLKRAETTSKTLKHSLDKMPLEEM